MSITDRDAILMSEKEQQAANQPRPWRQVAALLHRGGASWHCNFHFSGTRSILSVKGLWVWREKACVMWQGGQLSGIVEYVWNLSLAAAERQ